jgi:hypothetical protein
MKEYMPNRNRLADSANWLTDSANWLTDCWFTKAVLFTFAMGMIFASTTKLFCNIIKSVKQHFKGF